MNINLICKKEVKDSLEINNFFTKGKTYRFIEGSNPKNSESIGYVIKDDLGLRRWISREFKEEHFEEGK